VPSANPSLPDSFDQRFAALHGGGQPLPSSERAFFEPRFGRDFANVRVHAGPAAGELARSVHARAFTLGESIVLGAGEPATGTSPGRQLLAHELTHVVQQNATTVRRQTDPLTDPTRYDTLHQNLFVNAPTTTGAARQPWVVGTTDVQIRDAFKAHVRQQVETNPGSAIGTMSQVTTQADAEAAAIAADAALHTKYPQIPTQLSQAQIRGSVTVFAADFTPANAPSADFLANWIENQLSIRTNIENFTVSPAELQQLVQSLVQDGGIFPISGVLDTVRSNALAQGLEAYEVFEAVGRARSQIQNKTWAWLFNRLSSRSAAFARGGRMFLSGSLPSARHRPVMLHELLHLNANSDYRRWSDATTNPRLFNEGFTEILTREALTPQELTGRRSYQEAVDVITARVMPFISLDDLARAYFRGEVWRIEGASTVSQEMFERHTTLAAGATRPQEIAQSQGGAGIVQTVRPGSYFRLLNFGTDRSEPKAEHEAFLRTTIAPLLQGNSALRVRFVGHADDTGAASHNAVLARGRAAAVYRMALRLGIARTQLLDVNRPPGSGETEPTAGNTSVHGRAFNRRVEIFVTRQP
jgi:outer membrane protein OmpA-like peptidoglycan-associated protein